MRVIDYLSKKYGRVERLAILKVETQAFGIEFPLASGWLKKHGESDITIEQALNLRAALYDLTKSLRRETRSSAKKGLAVIDPFIAEEAKRIGCGSSSANAAN